MNRKNRKLLLATILLFYLLMGCTHTLMNPDYVGPKPLPKSLEQEFDNTCFDSDFTTKVIKEKRHYVIKQIQFAASTNLLDMNHNIILDYYDQKNKASSPVILVLPIFGGSNFFSNTFARYFAGHGYCVIIVHRQEQYKTFKDIDRLDGILRQIVIDHKQAIDWIEMQPDLDSERIGVFGISMGGIKAALISALDKRIKATVMCLTGGNLADIISETDENRVVRLRNEYMKDHHLSSEQFHTLLKQKITCDPINYAKYINANTSLMVLGRFDCTVPYQNGYKLWEKIGKPEKITVMTGHYTAIFGLPYVEMKALAFFNRKLR